MRVYLGFTGAYREAGILVESLIENAKEFSWDSVAGKQWITEKHTTEGHYRAEYQQVVPARLTPADEILLRSAGEHIVNWCRRQMAPGITKYFYFPARRPLLKPICALPVCIFGIWRC